MARSLRPALGALLALGLLASQLLGPLHLILVEHERCEHGELVHANEHGEETPADELPGLYATSLESHGHCDEPINADARPSIKSAVAVDAPTLSPLFARACCSAIAEHRAEDSLSLAPKQSPPV